MRALRRRAFTFVVPLVLSLVLGVPVAFATFTTGTFKTIGGGFLGGTVPNATTFSSTVTFNNTIAVNGGAVFPASSSIQANPNTGILIYPLLTVFTPDTGAIATTATANSVHFAENSDLGFDFQNCSAGTSAATDPTFCIHSHNQVTNEWVSFRHDGAYARYSVSSTGGGASGHSFLSGASTELAGIFLNTTPFIALGNTGILGWTSTGTVMAATDTGFARAAASVIRPVGANAGAAGWIQQWAGEGALNANYTNATASFTNTALITGANLASGRTYSFDAYLFFSDSTAADGAQFDFNAGGATMTNFRAHCTAANDAGAGLVLTNAATTALATAVQVALVLTTQSILECHGTLVPSSSSTFGIRAAQTAHTAGTLTINRGSTLNVRDVNPL